MAMRQGELVPQIFEHEQFGKIRVIGDSDNPRFCLSDACKMLGLTVKGVVQRLDKEVISNYPLETAGGVQQMYFVNEDGLYDCILESRKLEAKRFRKWITAEVVPSIRKTGMYINPNAPINPAFLRRMADEIEQRDKQIAALTEENAQLKPKAEYTEAVLESDEHLTSELIAKEYGECAQWLHVTLGKLGKIYKRGRTWYMRAQYAKEGYRTSETVILSRGKTVVNHYWTQKGRMFIYSTLKKCGILPLIERDNPQMALM